MIVDYWRFLWKRSLVKEQRFKGLNSLILVTEGKAPPRSPLGLLGSSSSLNIMKKGLEHFDQAVTRLSRGSQGY